MLRTVECVCKHPLYMGGQKVDCPECGQIIILLFGDPHTYPQNIPVLTTHKFMVSELNYFGDDFPEDGKNILGIYEDNTAIPMVWKEEYREKWVNDAWERNTKSLLFSWKYLTN